MAKTLQELIAADAQAGGVFFQGSGKGFDETVTHYPAGDLNAGEEVPAVIDMDLEDTGGLGSGEGARIDNKGGVKRRHNAVLVLPISVVVTERSGTATPKTSLFDFRGYRWRCVRKLASDAATHDFLVTRLHKQSSRRAGQ